MLIVVLPNYFVYMKDVSIE